MMFSSIVATASIVCSVATPGGVEADITFADLAPRSSMLVVAVEDMEGMVTRFEGTPLSNLCEIEAVKGMFEETIGSMISGMKEDIKDAGLDADAFMRPSSLGMCVYVDLDEETGQSRSYVLQYGDWGINGEKTAQAIDFVVEQRREAGEIEVDTRDVRGREITVITVIEENDDMLGNFEGMDDMMMFGDPSTLFPDLSTMYLVRDDSRFLIANDMLAIDDALSALDGEDGDSLKDTEDFQRMSAMLGDGDAYGMVRFEPLGELMAPMMMGPLGMAEPMIEEVFGGIRGLGLSFSVASGGDASGMAEIHCAVYSTGEKAGLLSLLDESTPIENAPPKMVPIDAISFSRLNIAFKDMIPMVRDIAASMPMGGQEIENGLDMYEPTIKPALDTLGPQVYFYGTVRKPIEMDSASSVMMVEAKDSDRVHPLLAMMGPSMGMEPRDFKGETIWSDDMGMMSLAVAGKWMLMGESRGVEQAIRAMGGGAETIGDNPIFASSIRRFDEDEVVGWGWTDIVEQYAVQRETLMNIDEMMGGFDEFGMGDMDEGMGDTSISKMFEELTPEDLARCVGPMIWSVTSSKDGLVQRILFLHPTKQAG